MAPAVRGKAAVLGRFCALGDAADHYYANGRLIIDNPKRAITRRFRDLADLNAQARVWTLEVAGVRLHGTTREAPLCASVPISDRYGLTVP